MRRTLLATAPGILLAALWGAWAAGVSPGVEIQLKDGRVLRGKLAQTAGLAEAPLVDRPDSSGPIQSIKVLDDELRRTYFSDRLIDPHGGVRQEENRQVLEKFNLRQRAMHIEPGRGGPRVTSIGTPLKIEPFDAFGRRTFTILTARGAVPVVQGITVLTPEWARVEGISHCWDMRIATRSIPFETLNRILLKATDPANIEHRKKIVRFYMQGERYKEAGIVLDQLLKAFPNLGADEKARLQESRRMINEFSAKQILRELKMRSAAGQYKSVWQFLTRFPAEGIGGEVLQPVREMIQDYRVREARRGQVIEQLKALAGRLKDTIAKENLKPILDEIAAEIGPDTLPRMAAFLQVAEDRQTPDTEKLALAVSGWLMGADAATPKLPAAISAYKVRNLIREYLNGGSTPEREQAFGYIKEEAGGLEAVAQLLAHMKPAVPAGEPLADRPDRYQLQVQGPGSEPAVTYLIQLPPEYNPYRLYPTVVTLCGEGDTADKQIDWWADYAARQGYIILAPAWTVEHQRQYGYSAREHAAVLGPLRDACRRFAIDTDRVFLSGHSIGGDAAWDIGLSHPDLWAGVIPIAAQADRYCNLYWRNARYVPFYVVSGSLDGTRFVHNALDLDRYLHNGFNTTVIEYQGRGHENFREEILHVFDWMGYFHRNFFPHKFACQTMRPWDNFFWWVEVRGLPPKSEVDPTNWPPSAGTQAAPVTGEINDKNGISIHTGASQATVWLSPKMLDFNKRSIITVNGRRLNSPDQIIRPSLHVLLEDVRTRGDRLHPFWVKLEGATGRVKGE